MLFKLMLLFILVPLGELALLVYVGTKIGVLYTILIVVGTGVAGAYLARSQGLATLAKIRDSIQRGVLPSVELFEGALILVGGVLLLTPGLITDVVGFLLLIPETRRVVVRVVRAFVRTRFHLVRLP